MVRRDFVSKYKQTVLGPAWMVIQPLVTTLVFTMIFGRVAQLSTDGAPAPLFYMSGLLGWNLFAGILGQTGNVLQANAGLFGKVYFPRLIVPMANTISAFIPFAIQLATFLGMLLFYRESGQEADSSFWAIPVRVGYCFLGVFQVALAGLGFGLIFSAATAVYRDLTHMLGFVTQIWMYLTPVIYPLSKFPPEWRWVPQLNPLTTPVETIRLACLGTGTVTPSATAISWAITLLLLLGGFLIFNHTERDYIDRA